MSSVFTIESIGVSQSEFGDPTGQTTSSVGQGGAAFATSRAREEMGKVVRRRGQQQ